MKILAVSGNRSRVLICSYMALCFFAFAAACSVAEPKTAVNAESLTQANSAAQANAAVDPKGPTISIDPNGPADTVRAFYKLLREKKFREAMFLTNLKPAVESLTDTELQDFSLDFEALAGQIPSVIEINGEIITGDIAAVTANLPDEESGKNETQTIKLQKQDGVWLIMTADQEAAKAIKQQGKDYFYNLRITIHQEEARKMLERISKAELAYSLQNGGLFADMATLVAGGLLPEDVQTNESTGYNYSITVSSGKDQYFANATPAIYGKSGKLSFRLQLDGKGISHVSSKDTGGKLLVK